MQFEVYEIGVDKYRVVEKSLFNEVNVFDVTHAENLMNIIKDISMNARNNRHKQPKFIFLF